MTARMAYVRRDAWRRWLAPLSVEAKLVALFLLTSDAGGVLPVLAVSAEDIATGTGISLAHVGLVLDELQQAGVAFHEGGLAYLAVLVHERPLRGPKQARGARARFDHLPDRPITRKAFLDVVASLESGTTRDAFAEPPPSWWERGRDERGNRVSESDLDERAEARVDLHARACGEETLPGGGSDFARAYVSDDLAGSSTSVVAAQHSGGSAELFPQTARACAREGDPRAVASEGCGVIHRDTKPSNPATTPEETEAMSNRQGHLDGSLAAAIERHAPELVDAIFVRVLEADWARIPIDERVGADVAVAAALQVCDAKGGRHRGAFRIALREAARREPLRGSQ